MAVFNQMNHGLNGEREIFDQALEIQSAEERERYLREVCGEDAELFGRVLRLLQSHDSSGFLLDEPKGAPERSRPESSVGERPGDIIGRYKLRDVLGEGGCGVVYVADQEEPVYRRVALKVIKPGMDTKSVIARFEAERQALAMMDHPSIARVLDAGTTERGLPFFVMELVHGLPVTAYCDKHELTVPPRLKLFVQICNAVQHAHQKGIIHRDLKPSNILIALHDEVAVPKIIDFGIAKAIEGPWADLTLCPGLRPLIGTPTYMSPEQAGLSGLDVDTRSDIYSLGVLLYELLTGSTPFHTKELNEAGLEGMRKIIREREPVRPSTRLAELRLGSQSRIHVPKSRIEPDLDWIVMKCLEKDRTRRYATANALAMEVTRHLNQEPIVARPPNSLDHLQKFIYRNKAAVGAASALLLLLLMGAVGTAIGLFQANRERAKAENVALELEANARELEASVYINSIARAHLELTGEPRNVEQAERLLKSCNKELRNWEWDYLDRQRLMEPAALQGPEGVGVGGISLSSDGRYLAAASNDGFVRIWDVAQARVICSLPAHTNHYVFSVAFDPATSSRLVSAGSDLKIKLWNWTAEELLHSWPCHFGFEWGLASAVAFSPDGRRVAGTDQPGWVRVWSTTDFAAATSNIHFDGGAVFSLAFSPDGRELAIGGSHGVVQIWDPTSGRRLRTLHRTTLPIACLAYSRDGTQLASAGFNGLVRIWRRPFEQEPLEMVAHLPRAVGLAFSKDGQRLASAGHDRSVKLWDSTSGRQVLNLRDSSSHQATCVLFSADGMRLAASSQDGVTRIWDATPLKIGEGEGMLTLKAPLDLFAAMDVSPDGRLLAVAGGTRDVDGGAPVLFWDTGNGQALPSLGDYQVYVFSLSFDPQSRFLATTGSGFGIDVWDLATHQRAFSTQAFPGAAIHFRVAYSPDGQHLVAAGHGGKVWVWDATTGGQIGMVGDHRKNRTIFNLVFSPDGRYLASAAVDGNVRVWDGARLHQHQEEPLDELAAVTPDYTDSLAFSPAEAHLVVPRDDRTAVIRDVARREELPVTLHTPRSHGFLALAYSPGGHWIASGGKDAAVHVFNARTGELAETFRGHSDEVICLAWLSRGRGLRLISASRDASVKFWDVSKRQADASAHEDKRQTASSNQ